MKVADILPYILNSDRIIFRKDGEEIARGFKGVIVLNDHNVMEQYEESEVKVFKNYVDIKHKEWKQKELMPPLMPEETAQYEFSDLQMSLYYIIEI